jgi:NAD(P)-dependent dehydrogenase (short-subunit alcohol dehydrogenase family)
MQLENRIAIVTGSDSGIGQAIATEFAREGADVAITYLHDADGAEETKRRVEAAGRRGLVIQTDVRDPDAVARLFERTRTELGTPDIQVNDAGVGSGGKPVADLYANRKCRTFPGTGPANRGRSPGWRSISPPTMPTMSPAKASSSMAGWR